MKRIILFLLFALIAASSFSQSFFNRWVPASGTNTYSTNITSYTTLSNSVIYLKFGNTNTGASTITINGTLTDDLRMWDGNSWEPLTAGQIDVNTIYKIAHQGSYFEMEAFSVNSSNSSTSHNTLPPNIKTSSFTLSAADTSSMIVLDNSADLVIDLDDFSAIDQGMQFVFYRKSGTDTVYFDANGETLEYTTLGIAEGSFAYLYYNSGDNEFYLSGGGSVSGDFIKLSGTSTATGNITVDLDGNTFTWDGINQDDTQNGVLVITTGGELRYRNAATIGGGVPTSRTISTTSPLSGGGDLSSNRTLSIDDAAADGTTKGAASFNAADFNTSSGLVSIDYNNGQAASTSNKGFLTSTDWNTFNNKQATGLGYLLASGGTASASNTFTFNTANWNNVDGTFTATANNQYHTLHNYSLTSRNTNGDILYGRRNTSTFTVNGGAPTGQFLIAEDISPVFTGTATKIALQVGGLDGNFALRYGTNAPYLFRASTTTANTILGTSSTGARSLLVSDASFHFGNLSSDTPSNSNGAAFFITPSAVTASLQGFTYLNAGTQTATSGTATGAMFSISAAPSSGSASFYALRAQMTGPPTGGTPTITTFEAANRTSSMNFGAAIRDIAITTSFVQNASSSTPYTGLLFSNTINQTNTGAGDFTAIDANITETAVLGNVYGIRLRNASFRSAFSTTSAPTAAVHIGGSTTARASLRIASGTAPSSPNDGDIWYDGSNYSARVSSTTYGIAKVLTGSASLDFPNTAASTSSDLTVTVTGAADGDIVSIGVPNASIVANSIYTAWVSAANTVTIRFSNLDILSAANPASGTFKVTVFKNI